MNPTPTAIKKIMRFVIFSLLSIPATSLAATFIKVQESTNIFKNGVLPSSIDTSEDGRYFFVEDGDQVYWLMSTTRPLVFRKIFDDTRNSLPFEKNL